MRSKVIVALPIALVFGFVVAAVVATLSVAPQVHAQEQNEAQDEAPEEEQQTEEASEVTYNYAAQPGDSFSEMARKAVQTYGIVQDVQLSQAQIVFAETNLTLEAGSPLLNQGQNVAIAEATVGEWVQQAQDLTDEQEAAWQPYTVGVNFNTDNVGESR